MDFAFLHAAHEVRETFAALRWFSWLIIGLAAGALVLAWGRIIAWARSPAHGDAILRGWGIDDAGLYFDIAARRGESWSAQGPGGEIVALSRAADGVLRAPGQPWKPVALLSSGGVRLPL